MGKKQPQALGTVVFDEGTMLPIVQMLFAGGGVHVVVARQGPCPASSGIGYAIFGPDSKMVWKNPVLRWEMVAAKAGDISEWHLDLSLIAEDVVQVERCPACGYSGIRR